MRNYVSPELRWVVFNAQDVITASNDLEFDVRDWLSGGSDNDGGFAQ